MSPYQPKILTCPDPENCDEWHNDEDSHPGETHHYGCECDDCMAYYQRVLK